jgi:hypothetical protein
VKIICNIMAISMAIFLVSCASVKNSYPLPDQALDALPTELKTKVVFYNGNGLNPLFLDGSWRVGIKINEVGVENLHIGKYVQLFLSPGTYKLELSHIDLFTFRDNYELKVGANLMYVKTYNTPVSTKYEIQESEPREFRKNFEAASNSNKKTRKKAK